MKVRFLERGPGVCRFNCVQTSRNWTSFIAHRFPISIATRSSSSASAFSSPALCSQVGKEAADVLGSPPLLWMKEQFATGVSGKLHFLRYLSWIRFLPSCSSAVELIDEESLGLLRHSWSSLSCFEGPSLGCAAFLRGFL